MALIFLADDDPAMRAFLSTALTRAGHAVQAYDDGLSAFAALQAAGDAPDLLLSDVVMPGMDGIELSQRARALFPSLKVLFVTGFSLAPSGSDADTPVLAKPLHLGQLIAQVEALLSSKARD